jgi:uncharacterized protein (TIGR02996 family)
MDVLTDGDMLLQVIREHPADNLPRRAYADWLEETGDTNRAEFIRIQVQLAELAECEHVDKAQARSNCPRCDYECRVWHLLVKGPDYWARWAEPLPSLMRVPPQRPRTPWDMPWVFARGFVAQVRLTCDEFMGPGAAGSIFQAHPVERVDLKDKRARRCTWGRREPVWEWTPIDHTGSKTQVVIFEGDYSAPPAPRDYLQEARGRLPSAGAEFIPSCLYKLLQGTPTLSYRSEDAARLALSRACVSWGQAEARRTRKGR